VLRWAAKDEGVAATGGGCRPGFRGPSHQILDPSTTMQMASVGFFFHLHSSVLRLPGRGHGRAQKRAHSTALPARGGGVD